MKYLTGAFLKIDLLWALNPEQCYVSGDITEWPISPLGNRNPYLIPNLNTNLLPHLLKDILN